MSVVIPTYNRAGHIGQAIQSVLAQTFEDFEVLIVDDGSTDNSEEIIHGFNDGRILYFRRNNNGGAAAARNTGIQAARGEFIAFLDSDDEWAPDKLEKQLAKFNSAERSTALVYSDAVFSDVKTDTVLKNRIPKYEGYVHELLLQNDFIGGCSSTMVRTDAVRCVGGFDVGLPSRQDWDLWIRMARQYSIGYVPTPLLICNLGSGDRISGSLKKILEGTKLVLNKHSEHMKRMPKAYGKHLAAVAQIELIYDRRVGWRAASDALSVFPFQPKLVAALCLSLFGKTVYGRVFSKWAKLRGNFYVGKAAI